MTAARTGRTPRHSSPMRPLLRPLAIWCVLALLGPAAPTALRGTVAAAEAAQAAPARDPDEYLVVDCLLPGKVRRLGRRATYLGARRPLRTTALDCGIRGGEYTAYDRADYRTALQAWLAEAELGDAQAQYFVGQIFEKGLGTEPDYVRAAQWYRRAAEQEHSAAQVTLGYLLERGLGVERDEAAAMNWYRRAAGLAEGLVVVTAEDVAAHAEVEKRLAETERELESLRRRLAEVEAEARAAETAASGDRAERERLATQASTLRAQLAEKDRALVEARAAAARASAASAPSTTTVATASPAPSGPKPTAPTPAPSPSSPASSKPAATAAASGLGADALRGLDFGSYHALVIGNGDYATLPDLPAARTAARDLSRLLETRYGFRVRLLEDADRATILEALNALREQLARQDHLLVFYAGHSVRDPSGERGWWQPIDADAESRVRWIPTQVLADHLELVPARHALIVADAHFPGVLTRSSIPRLAPGLSPEKRRQALETLLQKRSRLVLSPGEAVGSSGSSAFTTGLLEVLKQGSGVLEASTIYDRLNERLTATGQGQAPEFAPMRWAAHEGGADFLLVAKADR